MLIKLTFLSICGFALSTWNNSPGVSSYLFLTYKFVCSRFRAVNNRMAGRDLQCLGLWNVNLRTESHGITDSDVSLKHPILAAKSCFLCFYLLRFANAVLSSEICTAHPLSWTQLTYESFPHQSQSVFKLLDPIFMLFMFYVKITKYNDIILVQEAQHRLQNVRNNFTQK